ncbi:MAG: response regulator [Acidobacteriota bacterium]
MPPHSSGGRSPADEPDGGSASKPLILVVEDDDALRREICRILEDEGFQAIGAIHGLHALAQLETLTRPDLIILDLMMPVMNGWDFHARLKANPRFAHVPVLLLSAYVRNETHTGPKDVDVALQKPIRIEEFLGWVRRLARRLNR